MAGRIDLADTIRRLTAFAEVGADVLYAPGLPDVEAVRAVVRAVAPKPVNVVIGPAESPMTSSELASCGVKRISLGGSLYRRAMTLMVETARRINSGDFSWLSDTIGSTEIASLLAGPHHPARA